MGQEELMPCPPIITLKITINSTVGGVNVVLLQKDNVLKLRRGQLRVLGLNATCFEEV